MKTPKHFWMVGVLVSGLLLAVCVQQAAPAEPQRGGIYKEVRPKGPLVFGYPPEIVKTSYMDAVPCMESLTGISKEGNDLPVLATSWEIDAAAPSIKFLLQMLKSCDKRMLRRGKRYLSQRGRGAGVRKLKDYRTAFPKKSMRMFDRIW